MLKALFCHPPTGLFLRQDRCQTPLENKSAMEPPNELGYMAAMLENLGVDCRIRDFATEGLPRKRCLAEINNFNPDLFVIAVTSATLREDILFCEDVKKNNPDVKVVIKAAFLTPQKASDLLGNYPVADIILLQEYEITIKEIAERILSGQGYSDVRGAVVRNGQEVIFTGKREFLEDLDTLPFPARHLFNNKLYIRPDTAKPRATIQVARGCPYNCIFCLASLVEGNKVRFRAPKNIIAEIKECINKFGIRDFFLRADTFTLNKEWVIELCRLIIEEGLKIEWVVNSRVDVIDEERVSWMKKAGCWLISFGIESGSQDILNRMNKGVTVEDSRKAVNLCHKYGIKTYCFFVIGLPWDSRETIMATINFAKSLDTDFFLFHIALPFPGTELYDVVKENGLISESELYGHSHFDPALKTLYLSAAQLKSLWKKANFAMYSNPKYLLRVLSDIRSPGELLNYLRYGLGKLRGLMR